MIQADLKTLLIQINRKGLSLFPLTKFNAVSIYTTDFYENYDYDIVPPGQRDRLVKILSQLEFKQISGRIITNKDRSISFEFPRPNFTLGDDPADKAEKLINQSNNIIVLTPTQALLIYLKRFYDQIKAELELTNDQPLITEMIDLLYEQPANLDKVREWLGPSGQTDVFVFLKHDFRQAQKKGIADRRQHRFESKIINRLQ